MPKNEIKILSDIIQKNKLKVNQRINVRPDNIKVLAENRIDINHRHF